MTLLAQGMHYMQQNLISVIIILYCWNMTMLHSRPKDNDDGAPIPIVGI